jgi:3-oxoacyl-[acyl-carrier-protein] synthase-1
VLIGTSTSGILQTELAYRRRDAATGALPADFRYGETHNPFSVSEFIRRYLDLAGPAATVSSACSSSAKVFASASRMIDAGLVDAAVVGGVDSLCLTTLYGFNSLELTSPQPCRPFDRDRRGHVDRRGGGFRAARGAPANPCRRGDPAARRRRIERCVPHVGAASRRAGRAAGDGGRADAAGRRAGSGRLHQPARDGDAVERFRRGNAVAALFGGSVACSSTKGATGHALGAAGGIEAVIAALALREGFIPPASTPKPGSGDPVDYVLENRMQRVGACAQQSFGFGGTNCSLLFGRA